MDTTNNEFEFQDTNTKFLTNMRRKINNFLERLKCCYYLMTRRGYFLVALSTEDDLVCNINLPKTELTQNILGAISLYSIDIKNKTFPKNELEESETQPTD